MLRVLLLVPLFACAGFKPPSPPYQRHLDSFFVRNPRVQSHPPNVLGTGPWPLHRSATFKREGPLGYWGYTRITVAAEDACGSWIEVISVDSYRWKRGLVCVTPSTSEDPFAIVRVVFWQNGPDAPFEQVRDATEIHDLVGPMVAQLVPPERAGDLGAGYALLGVRDGALGSVVRLALRRPPPEARRKLSISLGFGFGKFTGHADVDAETVGFVDSRVSFALTRRLTVGVEGRAFDDVDYSPDAGVGQSLATYQLGARFRPWLGNDSYLTGSVGYAQLSHRVDRMNEEVGAGPALGVGVGYRIDAERDWALNVEIRDDILMLDRDQGVRHQLAALFTVELFMSTFIAR